MVPSPSHNFKAPPVEHLSLPPLLNHQSLTRRALNSGYFSSYPSPRHAILYAISLDGNSLDAGNDWPGLGLRHRQSDTDASLRCAGDDNDDALLFTLRAQRKRQFAAKHGRKVNKLLGCKVVAGREQAFVRGAVNQQWSKQDSVDAGPGTTKKHQKKSNEATGVARVHHAVHAASLTEESEPEELDVMEWKPEGRRLEDVPMLYLTEPTQSHGDPDIMDTDDDHSIGLGVVFEPCMMDMS